MERGSSVNSCGIAGKEGSDSDLLPELQYEDPESDFIAQMIAQKDAAQYEPLKNIGTLKIFL